MGATLTDTVTVSSVDGTVQSIAITITGTNDAAFITGAVTGSVTEDVLVDANGDLVASGQLAITDADAGEAFFRSETVSGTHGSLTIDADGSWTYEVDNDLSEVQGLGEGQFLTNTVTVTSVDGTEQSIEVTITGTNDVPFISGDRAASLTEDMYLWMRTVTWWYLASSRLRMRMQARRFSMRERCQVRMVL